MRTEDGCMPKVYEELKTQKLNHNKTIFIVSEFSEKNRENLLKRLHNCYSDIKEFVNLKENLFFTANTDKSPYLAHPRIMASAYYSADKRSKAIYAFRFHFSLIKSAVTA
eukprot:Pgem_evm1s11877